jgi:DNA-directed RNA polymerase specialized sigma24 family protein
MAMTCSTPAADFSEVWPDLSVRLRGFLRARRIPNDAIDDLVQEVGLRLYKTWDRIDQETVWALASTVVMNLVRDEMRRQEVRQRQASSLRDESETSFDDNVLARLELKRVQKVLKKLSRVDQKVLLAEWGQECDISFPSPAALKMARMRARQRLRAALEKASGLLPLWRLRKGVFAKSHYLGNLPEQLSQLAVALTVVVGVAVSASPGGPGHAGQGVPGSSSHRFLQAVAETGPHTRGIATSMGPDEQRSSQSLNANRRHMAGKPVASRDADLNKNFGPVRSGDDGLHVGEGGNGLGPYGVDQGYETSTGGKPAGAHARAKYEAPTCGGDVVIGGESDYECDGPGNSSAGAEADAAGHHQEVDKP